jgi:hypothetical protein
MYPAAHLIEASCLNGKKRIHSCCIPKAMVGWERRMWNALTEREVLSVLEFLRIEIRVHSNSRCCANKKINPITALEWPRGFQEVKVPRIHDTGTGWC